MDFGPSPVLIGLHGKKGAGKDTAFLGIQQWAEGRGLRAVRRGFADKLKLSAFRIFMPEGTQETALLWADDVKGSGTLSIEHDDLGVGERVGKQISGREFLQRYGTESHRDIFGKDFWVDSLIPPIGTVDHPERGGVPAWEGQFDFPDVAVVTDVRFENEAQRIKSYGGQIWEIWRGEPAAEDEHASEQSLPADLIDHVIDNTSTIEDLHVRIRSWMTAEFHMHFLPNEETP